MGTKIAAIPAVNNAPSDRSACHPWKFSMARETSGIFVFVQAFTEESRGGMPHPDPDSAPAIEAGWKISMARDTTGMPAFTQIFYVERRGGTFHPDPAPVMEGGWKISMAWEPTWLVAFMQALYLDIG